jgi:hypothetical protein
MARTSRLTLGAVVVIIAAAALGMNEPRKVPAEDLLGSWEEVTIKDMKTGTIDTVINRRINWSSYTRRHIFYAAMPKERKRTDPADLAKLSDDEKMKIRYAWVWNEKGQGIYNSFGSSYTWSGDTLTYNMEVVRNPNDVNHPSRERVVRVDRKNLIIQTLPDANGNWREETWRRLD